jgi:hypothetical protein
VWMQESCEPGHFGRRRRYFGKYLIGIGVAATLMALCVGWPIYDAVAQANDGTLTVEECLAEGNASIDPIAEELIKEGIIGENLLSTKVTDGMCEDVLQRAPDDTPVQRLVTAQNYIQENQRIENAIREAAAKGTGAKGPAHHSLAEKHLVLPRWTVLGATQIAAVAQQYSPPPADGDGSPPPADGDGSPPPGDGGGSAPGGGGGSAPGGGGGSAPGGGGGSAPGGGGGSAPGGGGGAAPGDGGGAGPGGGGDETEVTPSMRKAATVQQVAAAVVAEGDASIAEMLDRIEAAYLREGESGFAAADAARCGLEQALLNAISKELYREELIQVDPDPTPKELEYGDTVTVKLFISAAISETYDRLERQYEKVEEASEASRGCVQLTKLMEAEVVTRRFDISSHQGHDSSIRGRITRDTTWRWDVTANTEGKNVLTLPLGYVLTQAGEEQTLQLLEPAPLEATITIQAEPLAKAPNPVERNWRWLLPVGIVLTVAATLLVGMLRKREQRRPSEPGDEG